MLRNDAVWAVSDSGVPVSHSAVWNGELDQSRSSRAFRGIMHYYISHPTGKVDLALRDTVRLYEAAAKPIEKQFTFEVIMSVTMQLAGARM